MEPELGASSRWGTTEYLLAAVALAFIYTWMKRKPQNLPKGPKPLPIVGNFLQVKGTLYETFNELRKEYGDIFTFHMGSELAVVLNNPKLIREAFNESVFTGRPMSPPLKERQGGKHRGVIFSHGPVWMEQRRFALKTLRDFGFGKKSMESQVLDEATDLIDTFLKSAGKPIQTQGKFNAAVLNALWQLVNGNRFSHDDPELKLLIQELTSNIRAAGSLIGILGQSSSIIFFLTVKLPQMLFGKSRAKGNKDIMAFVRKQVEEHQETFQPDAVPRDFIDVYLSEARKAGVGNSFEGEEGITNLVYTLLDLFVAGAETTSTTLTWMFLLMALNPEKQKKLQEEIDRVVGKSRYPSLNDRPNMPYTEATIMEVMRYSAMVPLGVAHTALEDKEFNGYLIPKGTMIMPNLYICMRDPEIWGDPDNFRPERFLSADGKTVVKHEALIPFSVGKRVCLGETLARDELFLFSTSLCQRFKITQDPNGAPLKGDFYKAGVLMPKPYDVVLQDRYEEGTIKS